MKGAEREKYEPLKIQPLINLSTIQLLPLTVWADTAGESRKVMIDRRFKKKQYDVFLNLSSMCLCAVAHV